MGDMVLELLIGTPVAAVIAVVAYRAFCQRSNPPTHEAQLEQKIQFTSCAWCNRFRTPEGEWTSDLGKYQGRKHTFASSHALCPDCEKRMIKALDLSHPQKSCREPDHLPSFPEEPS